MKDLFKDVLGIEGVRGVVYLTDEGSVAFSQAAQEYQADAGRIREAGWPALAAAFAGITETEMVFDSGRLYIRKGNNGYLAVILEDHAPVSMVRLNCEVLMSSLDKQKSSKGIGQLFRKKLF
ncbi:MAG: hypothetical protein R6X08_07135 [Desulfosalsimonadaceae bacterium]